MFREKKVQFISFVTDSYEIRILQNPRTSAYSETSCHYLLLVRIKSGVNYWENTKMN